MRLMAVQYAGDYLEVHRKLQESGTETYYGHGYVLEELARVGKTFGQAAILCCKSPTRYNTKLPSGLTVAAANADPFRETHAILRTIREYDPTHLVVLAPMSRIIGWGVATNRRMLCVFADSFNTGRIRHFLTYGRLGALLNHQNIEWVANHGLNACLSLAKIGVARDKIVPWDYPHVRQPANYLPKSDPGAGIPTLVFVGALTELKGIGDAIEAVAELKCRDMPVMLKVAGAGDLDRYRALASRLGVESQVDFLGLISNDQVLETMRQASLVIIPSRHRYPEGLPLTIYEALCARTPIVASDHPMFTNRLVHKVSAMIYSAGKPAELATRVQELLGDRVLYEALSVASQAAWERLQIPVKWGELLYRWASDRADDRYWIFEHRLDAGLYQTQIGRS
jgi:glycosyltransferase involved in cell wall biosynthesis